DAALERHGVRGWFHRAYAWFGDRTAFVGVRTPLGLLPTARRLEPGMPAVLDVGPVLDSYAADIGYAFALGENATQRRRRDDLAGIRRLILEQVLAGRTMAAIYRAVDERLADL